MGTQKKKPDKPSESQATKSRLLFVVRLIRWEDGEFSRANHEPSNAKAKQSRITFDTQLKIVVIGFVRCIQS